ncbi:MAG: hypothetical protein GJV46_15435 [Geobacter sp.]|nr:hypothetical protein [Geobacter sp.]
MRTISAMLTAMVITATQAMAAAGTPESEGIGLLAACFIGFGVMIVLFQFIPGVMLMVGMLKGIFSLGRKDAHETTSAE